MVLSLFLALLAVAVLYWMGTIPPVAAGAALLVIVVCLALLFAGRIIHVSYLTRRAKELRAKWAGALTLIFGLPTLIDQKFYLFISRRDELLIENKEYKLLLPLNTIHSILIINAGALLHMGDAEIAERLHFDEKPRLNLTREWVKRHPDSGNQKLVLFWVQPEMKQMHNLGEILVFADEKALGDLTALLGRPEVALKTTVIDEKVSKVSDLIAGKSPKTITEGHTEPFLSSALEEATKKEENV